LGGCPAHWKALEVYAVMYAAKGIIQQQRHGSLLAPRKSFDILALYKSDYYYYSVLNNGAAAAD